jgi:HJR/Mrr/RecB family endonuclease
MRNLSKTNKLLSLYIFWDYTTTCLTNTVIRSLRDVALDYYSKIFEHLYGGYFSLLSDMSLDQCIATYFQIDFIDPNEEKNIGLLTYYLFKNKKVEVSLLNGFDVITEKVTEMDKNKELLLFEKQLLSNQVEKRKNFEDITIDDIDLMSGIEFENFIYDLFEKMGYSVNLTPSSGDQGIDIIAVKNGLRIGLQTKCYSSKVSNKAVQEVVAGLKYYQLTKAIVITNNYFTKSAIDLSLSNEVVLWDRSILKEKIQDFY